MFKLFFITSAIALSGATQANAKDIPTPKTLHVALDLSGSNPIVESEAYAKKAGLYVRGQILDLQAGDKVHMSMFGSLSIENNVKSFKTQITRRRPAKAVGNKAGQLIANIASGDFEPQNATNILFYFEFGNFNCESGDTIIAVTDGLEYSEEVSDPQALLETGKGLPKPDADYLKGCRVIFYGLGQTDTSSFPRSHVKNLKTAWLQYFKTAGADFTAIVQVH